MCARPSPPALIISPPRNTCPVTAFLLTCVHATHCSQGKNEYRAARAIHIGGRGQPDNDGVQIEAEPYLHVAAYPYLIRECRTHHQGNECVCHHSSPSLRSILYDLFYYIVFFSKKQSAANLLRHVIRDYRGSILGGKLGGLFHVRFFFFLILQLRLKHSIHGFVM